MSHSGGGICVLTEFFEERQGGGERNVENLSNLPKIMYEK
jgi:hypothetical protein